MIRSINGIGKVNYSWLSALIGFSLLFFEGGPIATQAAAADSADKRYIVKYRDGHKLDAEREIRYSNGRNLRKLRRARRMMAANLSDREVRRLRNNVSIDYVEADPRRYILAEETPYGVPMVQSSYNLAGSAEQRKVCIVDTGYDITHEDLPDLDRVDGMSQISAEEWSVDGQGHGTHVAGTVAALGNNGVGVIGVHAGGSLNLHIVKVFDNDGWWTYASDLINALDNCIENGSHIVSMSLGGAYSGSEETAFADAAAQDVLIVAAAGNDGSSSHSYPASYDSVVSVAAIDSSENHADFSQSNDQVELAAPGVSVLSTLPGNRYESWGGTSMATPHVSAAAAVVWGLHPTCSAAEVRAILGSTAKDLGAPGRDSQFGFGLVQIEDADAYLRLNGCQAPLPPPSPPSPPVQVLENDVPVGDLAASTGEELDFEIELPEGSSNLSVSISEGTGDADLYLQADAPPTTEQFDCRPYQWGNDEQCLVTEPTSQVYHVKLVPYSTYSGVTLLAKWDETQPPSDNQPPTAEITADPLEGKAPLTVSFDSSESFDDHGITNREWSFGDDTTASGVPSVDHLYRDPGKYEATLTVFDEAGLQNSQSVAINVLKNELPVASAIISPNPGETGKPITFDGTGSFDPDGTIRSWTWDLGDNSPSIEGVMIEHRYAEANQYNVKLTVVDDSDARVTAEFLVNVEETVSPPQYDIVVTSQSKRRGNLVRWSGAVTRRVEIHRNGVYLRLTRNDGRWKDRQGQSGDFYQVCNDRTNDCSAPSQ